MIYTGLGDGRIVRFDPESREPAETFAETGGRPLGLVFDFDGDLVVADAFRGLLSVSPEGEITLLTDSVDGERMKFVNEVSIDVDGKIWFTDSSRWFDQENFMLDFFEGRSTGRLLSYDPASGQTTVHLEGLGFANGVAVGDWGSYVGVAETMTARITQLTTIGVMADSSSALFESLPGHPDNLSFSPDMSTIWVALPVPRLQPLEALAGRPFWRKVLARMPGADLLPLEPYSFVIGLDHDGNVVHNLQDPAGTFPTITSAVEIDGYLYLGSIFTTAVGRIPVPEG